MPHLQRFRLRLAQVKNLLVSKKRDRLFTKIEELYNFAIERCLVAGNLSWIENAFLIESYTSIDDVVEALSHLTIRHLFRQVGDAEGTAEILEALHREIAFLEPPNRRFFRKLSRYMATELSNLKSGAKSSDERQPVVLSLVVWGDAYIDMAIRHCLSSMFAEGNLPALAKRADVTLIISTRNSEIPTIRERFDLSSIGVKLVVKGIPDKLIEQTVGDLKYWLLGAAQSSHLAYAAKNDAAFCMLFPDVVYSQGYLSNIYEIINAGASAVLLSGFGATERLEQDLAPYYEGRVCRISGDDLINLAAKNIHPFFLSLFTDAAGGSLPQNPGLFVNCGDLIEYHSGHYNVAIIRASALKGLTPRYFFTLDSEIEKFLPAIEDIHFRSVDDEYFGTPIDREEREFRKQMPPSEYADYFSESFHKYNLELFRRPYRLGRNPDLSFVAPLVAKDKAKDFFDSTTQNISSKMTEQWSLFERLPLVLETLKRFGASPYGKRNPSLATAAIEVLRARFGAA